MISDGFKLPALYNTQSDLEEVTLNLGVGGMMVVVGGPWGKEAKVVCGALGEEELLQQFIDY